MFYIIAKIQHSQPISQKLLAIKTKPEKFLNNCFNQYNLILIFIITILLTTKYFLEKSENKLLEEDIEFQKYAVEKQIARNHLIDEFAVFITTKRSKEDDNSKELNNIKNDINTSAFMKTLKIIFFYLKSYFLTVIMVITILVVSVISIPLLQQLIRVIFFRLLKLDFIFNSSLFQYKISLSIIIWGLTLFVFMYFICFIGVSVKYKREQLSPLRGHIPELRQAPEFYKNVIQVQEFEQTFHFAFLQRISNAPFFLAIRHTRPEDQSQFFFLKLILLYIVDSIISFIENVIYCFRIFVGFHLVNRYVIEDGDSTGDKILKIIHKIFSYLLCIVNIIFIILMVVSLYYLGSIIETEKNKTQELGNKMLFVL